MGYKPTLNTLPTVGAKLFSPSLDTVGVLARSVDNASLVTGTREFETLLALAPEAMKHSDELMLASFVRA
ncbi:amidase family protein [Paraburkholderia ferrariae]|uniref:amidase family protein n=1 Tax=Paraburkholderia ferrariae TaxID=386056 RepID=UPI0024809428|nr:amidase family protein [Paraburkholderia ferrariae]